VRARAAASVWA